MSEAKVNSSWLDKIRSSRVNTGLSKSPELAGKRRRTFMLTGKRPFLPERRTAVSAPEPEGVPERDDVNNDSSIVRPALRIIFNR